MCEDEQSLYDETPVIQITVESRYLEYSINRTLNVSNKTFGPILINLHKMTTRKVELSMSRTNLLVP